MNRDVRRIKQRLDRLSAAPHHRGWRHIGLRNDAMRYSYHPIGLQNVRQQAVADAFPVAYRRSARGVSDESFFRNHVGFIDDLKLRGSWGRLGNDQIADYLFQQTININSGNYPFNNTLSTGATPGRIANPDIGWETTEQTNGGVDIELMQNKLSFTGDLYNKQTHGILLQVPISSLVGQTAATVNAASVANVGWEAAVNWRSAIRTFNYTIGFNIADNKNRITNLPGGDQINANLAPSIRRVGEAIDAYFGIQAVGIFQTQAEVAAWATQNAKTGPGDLKYKDQNGDGKIDANDRVVMGDHFPHYTFGSNMSAQWKSFDVSMLLQGVGKQDVFLDGALIEGPTWENFFSTYLLDSWSPENPNAKWPRFVFRSDHNQNAPGSNSWYVRDGRYLELEEPELRLHATGQLRCPGRIEQRAHLSRRQQRLHMVAAEVDRPAGSQSGLDARDLLLPDPQFQLRYEPWFLRNLAPNACPHSATYSFR